MRRFRTYGSGAFFLEKTCRTMRLRIIFPGILTTVQDLGRPAWRSNGVPVCGAADWISHSLANALVGNCGATAALEIVSGGWKATVEQSGWAAHYGSGGTLLADGVETEPGRTLFLPEGTNLHIRPAASGNFSYLATAGGWDVAEVLGSRSTCLAAGFGGMEGRPLQSGDILDSFFSPQKHLSEKPHLSFQKHGNFWQSRWYIARQTSYASQPTVVGILPGPEQAWWTAEQQRLLETATFHITPQRDRMGIRLQPPADANLSLRDHRASSMLSTAVMPGTIQIPPDGCPIVLLADAQTTGGYPRVGQVIAANLAALAQVPTGQSICFQQVSESEAEQRLWKQRQRCFAIRHFVSASCGF